MGCCISTPKDDQNALKNQQNVNHEAKYSIPQTQTQTQSKSPPLIVEEEFVKEVLSETETPISKPQQVSILRPETKTHMHNMNITKDPIMNKSLDLEEPYEQVSLVSEICSVGESFSTTTTTTVLENREDEVTSKPSITEGTQNRHRNRAHSDATQKRSYAAEGNRIRARERRRPKSPARLPEIPPEKKVVVGSRPLRQREFSDKVWRDSGEGTCRRLRSPSCHRTVGNSTCRSELRQTDRSGRQLQPPPGMCDSETNDNVSMEELIMNPHASLECFIFL